MPGVRPGAKKVTSRWSGAQPTVLFGFFLVAFVFAFSADRGSLSVLIFGLIFGGVKSHFDWLACRDFTDEFNVTHSSCGLGKQVRTAHPGVQLPSAAVQSPSEPTEFAPSPK